MRLYVAECSVRLHAARKRKQVSGPEFQAGDALPPPTPGHRLLYLWVQLYQGWRLYKTWSDLQGLDSVEETA